MTFKPQDEAQIKIELKACARLLQAMEMEPPPELPPYPDRRKKRWFGPSYEEEQKTWEALDRENRNYQFTLGLLEAVPELFAKGDVPGCEKLKTDAELQSHFQSMLAWTDGGFKFFYTLYDARLNSYYERRKFKEADDLPDGAIAAEGFNFYLALLQVEAIAALRNAHVPVFLQQVKSWTKAAITQEIATCRQALDKLRSYKKIKIMGFSRKVLRQFPPPEEIDFLTNLIKTLESYLPQAAESTAIVSLPPHLNEDPPRDDTTFRLLPSIDDPVTLDNCRNL